MMQAQAGPEPGRRRPSARTSPASPGLRRRKCGPAPGMTVGYSPAAGRTRPARRILGSPTSSRSGPTAPAMTLSEVDRTVPRGGPAHVRGGWVSWLSRASWCSCPAPVCAARRASPGALAGRHAQRARRGEPQRPVRGGDRTGARAPGPGHGHGLRALRAGHRGHLVVSAARPVTRVLSTRLPTVLAGAHRAPLVAQPWRGPALLLLNPDLPLYSLPANTVAAPLVPVVTVAGLLAVCVLLTGLLLNPVLSGRCRAAADPASFAGWDRAASLPVDIASYPARTIGWIADPPPPCPARTSPATRCAGVPAA
ncbi:hypothetical protein QJS66_03765 [Kocuria rhizophila]|nr:hypothetical protein QJS66_03765 [Kocuria rhizophila]